MLAHNDPTATPNVYYTYISKYVMKAARTLRCARRPAALQPNSLVNSKEIHKHLYKFSSQGRGADIVINTINYSRSGNFQPRSKSYGFETSSGCGVWTVMGMLC